MFRRHITQRRVLLAIACAEATLIVLDLWLVVTGRDMTLRDDL